MPSVKGQPVLILVAAVAALTLPAMANQGFNYYPESQVQTQSIESFLVDKFARLDDGHKLKAALPAACTATPSTDPTVAANYYFWDVNGAPFNNSVYTTYVSNILTGLRLTYYFEYSTECTQQVQNFLSQFYYLALNGTCSTAADQFTVYKQQVYYGAQVFGTEFANSFYNCYLFGESVVTVAGQRLAQFSDFTDFYTSFLFNLLSQSLSIRNIATNIQTYYTAGNYAALAGNVAQIFRIVIDFASSNAASLEQTAPVKSNFATQQKEFNIMEKKLLSVLNEGSQTLQQTMPANPWGHLSFSLNDIFNIPLGIIEGSLGAIQSNQYSYFCSLNTTAARKNIYTMSSDFASGQLDNGIAQFYQFLQKTDNIIIDCGETVFTTQIPELFATSINGVATTNTYWGENFVQNILYNIGFQFTDILDMIFIDPTSTDPFWYYVAFRVGDFFIRFIFRDTTQ